MSEAGGDDKKYTQAEVDALIEERNKALEGKRDEILSELKEAKAKLKAVDGIDPEEHRALQAKIQDLETQKKADKAGVTSEQLAKIRQEVEADLVGRYSKMTAAELAAQIPAVGDVVKDNRTLRLDSVVKAEMAKAGARSERIDALFKLTADQFDLTDDGKPMLRDRPGIDVTKFVAEDLKKEYPELYNGTGSSGGGASRSTAGGGGAPQTIAANDSKGFIDNLEGIAKGTVNVSQ